MGAGFAAPPDVNMAENRLRHHNGSQREIKLRRSDVWHLLAYVGGGGCGGVREGSGGTGEGVQC